MVKIQENRTFDLIKEKLGKLPYGGSIEEIMNGIGIDIEIRTLQRRLKKLIDQDQIYTTGGSRATKYHLAFEINIVRETELEKLILSKKEGIQISPAGQKIMDAVSKPLPVTSWDGVQMMSIEKPFLFFRAAVSLTKIS